MNAFGGSGVDVTLCILSACTEAMDYILFSHFTCAARSSKLNYVILPTPPTPRSGLRKCDAADPSSDAGLPPSQ